MISKIKIILSVGLFAFLNCSCSDMGSDSLNNNGQPTLTFHLTRSPQDIIDNTQIYRFDTGWDFKQRVLGVSSTADRLTMEMPSGSWNLALVTADADITSKITSPISGQIRTSKMWETQALANELPSVPELRTAYLDNVGITANTQNNEGPVDLSRNVALVKVVIDKTRGLKTAGAAHEFELNNVPTTLDWAGRLMPDVYNPFVGTKPMKGTFTISNKTDGSGMQESDTLRFVIPAHKGNDYLSVAPADTLDQELTFSVNLKPEGGGSDYIKTNITIPRVPRVNHILLVRLSMLSEVEVSADILDWVDVNLDAGLSQTKLLLNKAEVGLAYRDTVYVNTNAPTFTIEKEAGNTWLTATQSGNMVLLEADVDTYVDNQGRSSYITVKAGNITKKVPVTQRPDRGTISVDNKRLILSPPNATKGLNVTTIGGDWEIIGSTAKATSTVSSGNVGTTPVSFTRTSTLNDAVYATHYGDTIVVFKNKLTLDTDTVHLSNLYIDIEDNLIEVDQPIVQPDTTSYVRNITVYGGDTGSLSIESKPSWIHSAPLSYYTPATGIFTFVCDREPEGEERYGVMTLAHTDDPAYTVTVQILQDIIVLIPEFDYYTVKFTWVDNDVDIRCGFIGNSGTYLFIDGSSAVVTVPFDNRFVGWNLNSSVSYISNTLVQWGSDATGGQGETVYFNAPIINASPYPGQYGVNSSTANLLPRKLSLSIAAGWFTSSRAGDPITCTVAAYRGGGVTPSGTNFNFSGTYVYGDTRTYNVSSVVSASPREYFEFCTILYDRKKHTAQVNWTPVTRALQTSTILVDVVDGDEKK